MIHPNHVNARSFNCTPAEFQKKMVVNYYICFYVFFVWPKRLNIVGTTQGVMSRASRTLHLRIRNQHGSGSAEKAYQVSGDTQSFHTGAMVIISLALGYRHDVWLYQLHRAGTQTWPCSTELHTRFLSSEMVGFTFVLGLSPRPQECNGQKA